MLVFNLGLKLLMGIFCLLFTKPNFVFKKWMLIFNRYSSGLAVKLLFFQKYNLIPLSWREGYHHYSKVTLLSGWILLRKNPFFKGLVAAAIFFLSVLSFSYIHTVYIHSYPFRRGLSPFSSLLLCPEEKTSLGKYFQLTQS